MPRMLSTATSTADNMLEGEFRRLCGRCWGDVFPVLGLWWCAGCKTVPVACTCEEVQEGPEIAAAHKADQQSVLRVAPGAAPGSFTAGSGGGPVETSGVTAVVPALLAAELRTIIRNLSVAWQEDRDALERERRENARLREEFKEYSAWAKSELEGLREQLARAKEAEAEALVQSGEASERAWEASVKLDALVPRAARHVLEKNAETIRLLRRELALHRGVLVNWRASSFRICSRSWDVAALVGEGKDA